MKPDHSGIQNSIQTENQNEREREIHLLDTDHPNVAATVCLPFCTLAMLSLLPQDPHTCLLPTTGTFFCYSPHCLLSQFAQLISAHPSGLSLEKTLLREVSLYHSSTVGRILWCFIFILYIHHTMQIQEEEKQIPLFDGKSGKEFMATTGHKDSQSFAFLLSSQLTSGL